VWKKKLEYSTIVLEGHCESGKRGEILELENSRNIQKFNWICGKSVHFGPFSSNGAILDHANLDISDVAT